MMKKLSAKAKVGFIVLATGLVLTLGVGLVVYRIMYAQAVERYTNLVFNSARMATAIVDGDRIDYYLTYGADDTYHTAVNLLRELKISNNLTFLYIVRPDINNNIKYIFDIYTYRSDLELISRLGDIAGEDDVYLNALMEVYLTGQAIDNAIITRSVFGHLASAYVPVFDSTGRVVAVACADLDMNAVLRYVRNQTILVSTIVFVIFLISSIIILVFYTKDLSDSERVATELGVAKRIQERMLPTISPPISNRKDFDIYACMTPKREIGGDFYDFFLIDDNTLAIVIGDVSDKSVPAALFMSSTMMLIKNSARMLMKYNAIAGNAPHKVFEAVNDALCEKRDPSIFVTSFMGYLDLTSGEFTYVNAGHEPPLFKKNGGRYSFMEVEPSFVLAGKKNFQYEQKTIQLSSGDILCLYTDGVIDAANKSKKLFSEEGLEKAANIYSGHSAKELVDTIQDELKKFAGDAEQEDDIAILALRFIGDTQKKVGV